jgi:hypothetical protein
MRTLKRYAVVMAAVMLAACGDDDKSGTGPGGGSGVAGSFTASAAGDLVASFSGMAGHASVAAGEEKGFGFAMEDTPSAGTATASILFIRTNPALPSVGANPVVVLDESTSESDFMLLAALTDAQGGEWICTAADAGAINVTSATAQRVRGSFAVPVECLGNGGATKALTLSGNFDSRVGSID